MNRNPFVRGSSFQAMPLIHPLPKGVSSKGTISEYTLNAPKQFGQPYIGDADVYGLITPARMREIILKTPTAGGCFNAAVSYACGVKVGIRNVDVAKNPPKRQEAFLLDLMRRPNPQDNWREFRYKTFRDLFILDYAGIEVEPGPTTPVANLWALDAARLKVDYDQHGTIDGFDMLDITGSPITGQDGVHAWNPDEIVYLQQTPRTESLYPTSKVMQLFPLAVIESQIWSFINARFTDSNIPYGLMNLGDITPNELKTAISMWNQQAEQLGHAKIMFMNSKGANQFFPFHGQLKDLQPKELLTALRGSILGILGVTANELGEADNVNKANGFNLSYTFKKRCIEPLLDTFCDKITSSLLWGTLEYKDVELYYEDIDSRDELLQAQIDDLYIKQGVWSINYVRNRKGLSSIPGGDSNYVFTGAAFVPVALLDDYAEAELEAVQVVSEEAEAAIEQTQTQTQAVKTGSLPSVNPAQAPEKTTSPSGQRLDTRIKNPKLTPNQAPQAKKPNIPRGPDHKGEAIGHDNKAK